MKRRNFFKVVTGFVAGVCVATVKGSKRAPTKDDFQKALNEVVKDKLDSSGKQKFHTGDRVYVGNLPENMSHFRGGNKNATVLYSYYDRYGGSNKEPSYALDIDGFGFNAWYPEWLLIKIKVEVGRGDCRHSDPTLVWAKKTAELYHKANDKMIINALKV